MFEHWKIRDFDAGMALASLGETADAGWVDATIPGDTYLALAAAGRIGDPYAGRVEKDVAWVADREWCWRTEFETAPAAGERIELLFEGLDTFAAIYLNGELLGATDNMFRPWRFEVASRLCVQGSNSLAIIFAPASQRVADKKMALWPLASEKTAISKRNFIRKAQFGWGWDWGPYLPTVGPWLPVRLERCAAARVTNLHFSTLALHEPHASVRIEFNVERVAAADGLSAEVALLDPNGVLVAQRRLPAQERCSVALDVADAQLWWTADLGAQPLYTLRVNLLLNSVQVDTLSRQVGIRTIQLDTSADADEPGTNFFRFVLNGVAIFARGANWIPATSFVGTVDVARYTDLIRQTVAANMNMLRVWGGGIYEHELFYELCDRLGVLVWQDFMFACAPYPQDDPAFVASVREEVEFQIRRLRNHPSLALWCGNNECQVLQDLINQMTRVEQPLQGALYYDQIIPDAIARLDAQTPYWPGSPFGGPSPNSMRAGDIHNWTVWHGIPPVPDQELVGGIDRSPAGVAYTRYAEDQGRFISEFGIQSAPALSTLQRWMNPDDLLLDSEGFLERIKDEPKDKVNAMLIPVTGLPETLQQYIDFTMLTQAEGLKFGIEHFRRRKPHCSGTLIWQLNDCWPCISWSLIDYDGVGKAAYFATARAYAPLLASFKSLGDGRVELWITNDSLQAVNGEAIVDLIDFKGAEDWSARVSYSAPANGSLSVWSGRAPASNDRMLCVRSVQQQFLPNRHLLVPVKDLALQAGAKPDVAVERTAPHELRVSITASIYLMSVQIDSAQATARYSDNYFDLRPGESRTVIVRDALSAALSGEIEVRCWNQAIGDLPHG